MALIPENQINEIKERADIVTIVSEYVNLKKAGSNFKGLCPFHNEKTPSFIVNEHKGNFKCFGCGEGGDAISFVMKIHNLTYIEAIKFLAEKFGIELQEAEYSSEQSKQKKLFYDINSKAAKFFMKNFLTDSFPQSYLKKRGIKAKVANSYYLGYAKNDNFLLKYLKSQGFLEKDMVALGLIGEKDGRFYDKFRDRLMFPILNNKNKVIGFGGRTLTDNNIKYLNSPDSLVFHKGENVYGIDIVSKKRYRDKILLVEGYMDVISLYNHGIDYALATLGTALTPNQAKLIKRYSSNIYIAYDGDEAGIKATLRAIDVFKNLNVQVGILSFPDGKDPDEYISKYGKDEFEKLINKAVEPIDFKLKKLSDENLSKMEFISKITEFLADIEGNVIRDLYITKAAEFIGVSTNSLRQDVSNVLNEKNKKLIQSDRIINENKKNGYKPIKSNYTLESEVIVFSLLDKVYFERLRRFEDVIHDPNLKELLNHISILYGANRDTLEIIESDKFRELGLKEHFSKAKEDRDKNNMIVKELIERLEIYKLELKRDELMSIINSGKADQSVLTQYSQVLNELTKGVK